MSSGITDYVARATRDLDAAESAYRRAQAEAWGLCSQFVVRLKPGNADSDQFVVDDEGVKELVLVLDHLRDRARTLRHCQDWLGHCERIAAHQHEQQEGP